MSTGDNRTYLFAGAAALALAGALLLAFGLWARGAEGQDLQSQLDSMRFGVANARRAWLEAENVLNTRGPEVFLKQLHHGHR